MVARLLVPNNGDDIAVYNTPNASVNNISIYLDSLLRAHRGEERGLNTGMMRKVLHCGIKLVRCMQAL